MTDIANRVGASRSAVSFVLNGLSRKHGISPELEKQVLRAARDMKYRPSLMARSLAGRRTFILGLLMPDLAHSFSSVLVDAVVSQAQHAGYQVFLSQHSEDPKQFRRAMQTMLGWHVDGAIVVPAIKIKGTVAHRELRAAAATTSVVLVERDLRDPKLSLAIPDVAGAFGLAVRKLLDAGHRRIGILSGPRELAETAARERGYRQAMEAARAAVNPRWVSSSIYGEDIAAQAEQSIASMFDADPRPTALVIPNNTRAIIAVESLRRRGLNVPADVSVISVSGSLFPNHFRPQLSLFRLDYERVGREAVRAVLDQLDAGPDTRPAPRRILTPSIWVPGESIAPCRERV